MPRVKNAVATKKRRKRILERAKGFFGNKSRLFRYAKDAVHRGDLFSYDHRRMKKTEMRQLWIIRINAAVRPQGLSYSRFMSGIKAAGIELDRKALSEMAIHDEAAFKVVIEKAQTALKS
jgi:large subunit ribosomal protein L20